MIQNADRWVKLSTGVLLALAGLAASPALANPQEDSSDSMSDVLDAVDAFGGGEQPATIGPDVIVGDLHDLIRHGRVAATGITAYNVGTTSCNVGDRNLRWEANNRFHPVIAQNMYRLKDGRFELIGLSWLKHGFVALTENICGRCSGQGGSVLGVNCSDPYGAGLNGSQGSLGPRSQVNAYSGFFTYPVNYSGIPSAAQTVGRRIQVLDADINPALNAGARYFVEGQYVSADDAVAGNQFNNASYREIYVSGSGTTFNISFSAAGRPTTRTQRMNPAIYAWKAVDPAVTLQDIRVPNEGQFSLAYKVTEPTPGVYHYEYALFNLNSDRSAGAVSFPAGPCRTLSNIGWRGPVYHSGEPQAVASSWTNSQGGGRLTFAGDTYAGPTPEFPNRTGNLYTGNALRWNTLQNYRFDSTRPPMPSKVRISLWKPGAVGEPEFIDVDGQVPASADVNADGSIDFFDYNAFVTEFEAGTRLGDFNLDGFIDFFDFDAFTGYFAEGC
jgi:hypothetical protein